MKKVFKAALVAVIFMVCGFHASAWDSFESDSVTVADDESVLSEDSLKIEDSMYDMLCLVAHFEGVKVNAYWDAAARIWTIGIGNTVRPDGKPVRQTDRIADKDELLGYFSAHVRNYMMDDLLTYLPIELMSKQEIAAVGSLCYNCGSGILRNSDETPSTLARAIADYIETRGDSSRDVVKTLMDKKITSRGRKLDVLVKRRAVEELILFGEVNMVDNSEYAIENSVNFAEVSLGAAYSLKIGELDDIQHVTDSINNCQYGRNLNDSIEYAFNHPNPVRKIKSQRRNVSRRRVVRR